MSDSLSELLAVVSQPDYDEYGSASLAAATFDEAGLELALDVYPTGSRHGLVGRTIGGSRHRARSLTWA